MLLERLRAETRLAHDRIERDIGLTERMTSPARYRALLGRFHGFHAAWEEQAGAVIADPDLFDGRRKLPLLVKDLRALGASEAEIAALPLCRPLVPMPTRSAALGAMYVIEGSTLGGAVIAHQAGRTLGLCTETGCAYFGSYGRGVGLMWREFRARLHAASAPGIDDLIVASANDTFECMRAWLCGGEAA